MLRRSRQHFGVRSKALFGPIWQTGTLAVDMSHLVQWSEDWSAEHSLHSGSSSLYQMSQLIH